MYSKKCYELYCSCCLKNKWLPCLRYGVCITFYAVLCIVLNLDIYTCMHYIISSRKLRSFLPYSGRPVCMSSSHTLAWFSFTLCRGRLLPSPLRDRGWSLRCFLHHLHWRWGGLLVREDSLWQGGVPRRQGLRPLLHREDVIPRLLLLLVPVLLLRHLLAPGKGGCLDTLWASANFLFIIFFLDMWLRSSLKVLMLIIILVICVHALLALGVYVFTVFIPTCLYIFICKCIRANCLPFL